MRDVGVYLGDVENLDEWRFKTRVAEPKLLGENRTRKRRCIKIKI
jgi:hypothetical protein